LDNTGCPDTWESVTLMLSSRSDTQPFHAKVSEFGSGSM
jgi:hypothetical protein